MFGYLMYVNRRKGFRVSLVKSTREILWALRLRKTMD
jgi:hypothetical protein